MINKKTGNFHAERAVPIDDFDEYSLCIFNKIAQLDESRATYLEERNKRLDRKIAEVSAPEPSIEITKRKRTRNASTKAKASRGMKTSKFKRT